MMRSRSLVAHTTIAAVVSIILVAVLLGATFVVAVARSVEAWEAEETLQYRDRVVNQIRNILIFTGAIDGDAIERYIDPYLDRQHYLVVFDGTGRPIFYAIEGVPVVPSTRLSERLPTAAERTEHLRSLGIVSDLPGEIAVRDTAGTVRAYVLAGTSGYGTSRANRAFSRTAVTILLAGSLVTLPVALLVSLLFSRVPAKGTARLASRIAELPRGKIGPLDTPIRELATIAAAGDRLATRLRNEEAERRRWMQDIAHDLRTPVSAIRAQLEAIGDGVYDPSPERIAAILANVSMVQRLIEDLSLLSTLETPERPVVQRPVDLAGFLDGIIVRFPDIRRTDAIGGLEISGDADLLERALVNLVDNAHAYRSPADAPVTVSLARDGHDAVIRVSNPGAIPQESREAVFHRLFRGDPARNDGRHGLGLSIARAIAQRHNGALLLEAPGPPTVVFALRIPVSS